MSTKVITFGTRLRKDNVENYYFTCRQLIAISPRSILSSMEFDNRYILDEDVKECLSSQTKNKEIFGKILKLHEKRVKIQKEISEMKEVIGSDDLSMGNSSTLSMFWLSGSMTGM